MANSMTAWQRPTSLWRTNSHPQTFLLLSTDCTDFTDFIFCVISVICWLLSSKDTNYTKSFCFYHQTYLMSRITFCQRIARIARNYFFITRWTWCTWWLAQWIIWLIWLIWWLFFKPSSCSSWCLLAKETVCCWINFCPLSPKLMRFYNSLIIIHTT